MDYCSFSRPRKDGWLSWPCWLTDSGRVSGFNHKVVTRPAANLVQDRESSLAMTGGLTTMLRRQVDEGGGPTVPVPGRLWKLTHDDLAPDCIN